MRMVRRVLPALALLLALAPAAARAYGTTFHHEAFTVRLPAGWRVAEPKPGPKGRRFVPAKSARAAESARVVHFADGRGNYFTVHVDRAADLEADAIWTVHVGADGASVEVGAEGAPCTGGGACSAGNGTLEVGTLPPLRFGAHTFTFEFGNTEREQGVSLEPHRWILKSFRAR
jgi:hypothetical protein